MAAAFTLTRAWRPAGLLDQFNGDIIFNDPLPSSPRTDIARQSRNSRPDDFRRIITLVESGRVTRTLDHPIPSIDEARRHPLWKLEFKPESGASKATTSQQP